MSSAILYLAIVVIWAGVLIPRWLRRDSSSSERPAADPTTAHAADEQPGQSLDGDAPRAQPTRPPRPAARSGARRGAPGEHAPGEHVPGELEHKRVLSARRRLLGMLMVLALGSGALAVTRLAAWWVVVPPSAMLLCYVTLLREAAKADTERREAEGPEAEAERRELARTREGRPAVAGKRAAPVRPAAPPVPVPGAEVIDISASRGPGVHVGEEFYDQYADAKLRAVGDLSAACKFRAHLSTQSGLSGLIGLRWVEPRPFGIKILPEGCRRAG